MFKVDFYLFFFLCSLEFFEIGVPLGVPASETGRCSDWCLRLTPTLLMQKQIKFRFLSSRKADFFVFGWEAIGILC